MLAACQLGRESIRDAALPAFFSHRRGFDMSALELVGFIGFALPLAIGLWSMMLLLFALSVRAIFCGLENE
jgi:hypothetical protein